MDFGPHRPTIQTSPLSYSIELNGPVPKNLSKFPKHGWKVKLDHQFPERRDQNLKPRLSQLLPLIPLGLRYLKWWTGPRLSQTVLQKKEIKTKKFRFFIAKYIYRSIFNQFQFQIELP